MTSSRSSEDFVAVILAITEEEDKETHGEELEDEEGLDDGVGLQT